MSWGSCKCRTGCGAMPRLAPGPFTLPGKWERLQRRGQNTLSATARIKAQRNLLEPRLGGHGSGRQAGRAWLGAGVRPALPPPPLLPGAARPAPCTPAVLHPPPQPRRQHLAEHQRHLLPACGRPRNPLHIWNTSGIHLHRPAGTGDATSRPPQGWGGPGWPCPAQ